MEFLTALTENELFRIGAGIYLFTTVVFGNLVSRPKGFMNKLWFELAWMLNAAVWVWVISWFL